MDLLTPPELFGGSLGSQPGSGPDALWSHGLEEAWGKEYQSTGSQKQTTVTGQAPFTQNEAILEMAGASSVGFL